MVTRDDYNLGDFNWYAPKSTRGRLPVKQVNSFKADPKSIAPEVTAENAIIPIVYGRAPVPGKISLFGADASGNLIVRVVWCSGEIFEIENTFINSEALPSTVEVRHYRGTSYQGVDDWIDSITTLTGYDDDLILVNANGLLGIAYSVFRIPSGAITGAPRFHAIIKGTLVPDPREEISTPEPFRNELAFELVFDGTDSSTPTTGLAIDADGDNLVTTWVGDANIQSNEASLDGTGDFVHIPDSILTRFGNGKWTFETKCTPQSVASSGVIASKGSGSTTEGFLLFRSTTSLNLSLSSNGTSYDILSSTTVKTSVFTVGVEVDIVVEFDERTYKVLVDGVLVYTLASIANIHNSTDRWEFGASNATSTFNGSIRAARLTNALRFGGGAIVVGADPFNDSTAYENRGGGYVYDDHPILCFNELVENKFYGLGSTINLNSLITCSEWNESNLGGVDRCRISLVISDSKTTEEWLDLLITYADCFWLYEDEGITVIPDQPISKENPSGWHMVDNGEFLEDTSGWTLSNFTYSAPFNLITSTATGVSTAARNVSGTFIAGDVYVAQLNVPLLLAGSGIELTLGGVPLIESADVTAVGLYTYEFIATGSEDGLELKVTTDSSVACGIGLITIRRKFWREDSLVAGSLKLAGLSDRASPTKVSLQYTTPENDTPVWNEANYDEAIMPGVESGEDPLIETTMTMKGIYRIEEASTKAQSKLARMQNRTNISWTSTDLGIALQRGTVVEVYDAEYDLTLEVIVEASSQRAHGRYSISGSNYSVDHYPTDLVLPDDVGQVPVGAVALLYGSTVPSGWSVYTAADTKFILGAGETIAIGATGGSATFAGFSPTTDSAGVHGSSETTFQTFSYTALTGSGSGRFYTSTNLNDTGHTHTYSTGTIEPDLPRVETLLVEKITTTSTTFPKEVRVFGLEGISIPDLVKSVSLAGKIIQAASTYTVDGVTNQFDTATTGSTSDAHDHTNYSNIANGNPPNSGFDVVYDELSGGTSHAHNATLTLTRNIKVYRLAMYIGSDDFSVVQGIVVAWKGTLSALFDNNLDWTLCDGRLSTPAMEDAFLEIAGSSNGGTSDGDNTLSISGYTSFDAGHSHRGNLDTGFAGSHRDISHSNTVKHKHGISDSGSWTPPYYALAFIMFNPNPVYTFYDVALLIPGGEANGSTTIVDVSNDALTLDVQTGNTQYSDTELLFSLTTLRCTSDRNGYYLFEYFKRFTAEGFFMVDNAGVAQGLFNNGASSSDRYSVQTNSSGEIELVVNSAVRKTGITITADTWFYVSLNYDGAEWRLYTGLVSVGTAAIAESAYADVARDLYPRLFFASSVVGFSAAALAGYCSQIQVTRNGARHSGSVITIPTTAFPEA